MLKWITGLSAFMTVTVICAAVLAGCGREPSSLLRQGQLPVYDFPLYLSDGSAGIIYSYDRNANRTVLISGLNNPQGVATDRFNNLYVVERGLNRLIKVNTLNSTYTVVTSTLNTPSVVAVDSFGQAFVTQDLPHNVVRANDMSVIANYYALPAAIVAGVNDLLIIGDAGTNTLYWGTTSSSPSATVSQIVNVGVDAVGRVYAAEGLPTNARVLRFDQRAPDGGGTVMVEGLSGPSGIAVDPAGNVYVVEKGNARVLIAGQDGVLRVFTNSGLVDPSYVALTQY